MKDKANPYEYRVISNLIDTVRDLKARVEELEDWQKFMIENARRAVREINEARAGQDVST